MHSGPFAGKTFDEAFQKPDTEPTPSPKPKSSESFLSAGEAIKAGHSFAQWQDPISRAFVEERIDVDHPAYQSIDPSNSPSIDDYNHARSLFGRHVLTTLGHFGRVVDVAPDAKSLTVEHENGQRSSHLPSGLTIPSVSVVQENEHSALPMRAHAKLRYLASLPWLPKRVRPLKCTVRVNRAKWLPVASLMRVNM
jgi:hypothetical protein